MSAVEGSVSADRESSTSTKKKGKDTRMDVDRCSLYLLGLLDGCGQMQSISPGSPAPDGCGQMQSISPGPLGWMWTDAVYISWISCPGWMWTDAVYITWASWMDMDRCSLYLQHRLQQHRREKDEDDKVQGPGNTRGRCKGSTLGRHSSVARIGGRTWAPPD